MIHESPLVLDDFSRVFFIATLHNREMAEQFGDVVDRENGLAIT